MTFMIIAWSGELFKYKIKCSKTRYAVDGWAYASCASNLYNFIKSVKVSLSRSRWSLNRAGSVFKESVMIYFFLFVSFSFDKPARVYKCSTTLFKNSNNNNNNKTVVGEGYWVIMEMFCETDWILLLQKNLRLKGRLQTFKVNSSVGVKLLEI